MSISLKNYFYTVKTGKGYQYDKKRIPKDQ